MVGEKLSQNLKDRASAVKTRVTDQIDQAKTVFSDVRSVAHGQPTSLPGKVGTPGRRGGLPDEFPAMFYGTSDSSSKHLQKQIEITRRWIS